MSLLLTALTRLASCVVLFAVILYAPALAPVLALPKWVWHARGDGGLARRPPATVTCPRRLAEAEVRAVGYGVPHREANGTELAACVAAGSRA